MRVPKPHLITKRGRLAGHLRIELALLSAGIVHSALNAPASEPTLMVCACGCNIFALCCVLCLAVFHNGCLVVSVLASHARQSEFAWSAKLDVGSLGADGNALTIKTVPEATAAVTKKRVQRIVIVAEIYVGGE